MSELGTPPTASSDWLRWARSSCKSRRCCCSPTSCNFGPFSGKSKYRNSSFIRVSCLLCVLNVKRRV